MWVLGTKPGSLTTKSSLQAPYTQNSPGLAKDITETVTTVGSGELGYQSFHILGSQQLLILNTSICDHATRIFFKNSYLLCMCAYKH